MDNLSLLFSENNSSLQNKIEIHDRCYVYKQKESIIGASSLRAMIRFINTLLKKYPGIRLPVIFDFGKANFFDKLTYVVFECLCDYLIEDYGYKVRVRFEPRTRIHTAGIRSSPLWLLTTGEDEHILRFKRKFNFEIYKNHYRRVLTHENLSQPDLLCKIMDDIACFQNPYGVSIEAREAIAEVIVELIGNASEHGGANCLIDFDIAPSYYKQNSTDEFLGLNLAIVNFSKQLLGTALENKLENTNIHGGRYDVVRTAYQNHKQFFNNNYTRQDFFNLTAFQHKISGRKDSATGGTGLTKLIESLELRSESHMCYAQSGSRVIIFKPEYLKYSDDGWLGFNVENDYTTTAPDKKMFLDNHYILPGTAFNLNFVMKKEN